MSSNNTDENQNLENVSGSAGEFGNLLSGLQYDSAFEKCVYDVLYTGELNDYNISILSKINGQNDILTIDL